MTISDLRLSRRFIVDRQAGTLVNLSLFADVMFRRMELVRRTEIANALIKSKDHPPLPRSLDRFWIESELGISGRGAPEAVAQHQKGAVTEFVHRGQTVAAVTPGDTVVPHALLHGYAAFIRHTLPLNPAIASWLAQNGRVPKEFGFISEARGRAEKIVLRLRTASTVDADFPMPEKLTLVLLPWGTNDPEVRLVRDILPKMVEAVSAPAGDRDERIAEYRKAIAQDFKAGHKFTAALRLTELALRWGRAAAQCTPDDGLGPCESKAEIDKLLRDDPRSVAMFKATAIQNKEPAKAIALWRGLDRKDVPNGYVVDIFLARLLSEQGDRAAAAKSFAAAFAGNPGVAALYRALGDHFARVSRLDLAWLCYDLGRALPDRAPPDALSGIDTIEQNLVETYPDMF